jgi:putative ABC transport system ATP-binding protein
MNSNYLISALGLKRSFGQGDSAVQALGGVSLDVLSGELVAIMGASGSGKSTLLAALGGLDLVDEGEVFIEGRSVSELNAKEASRLRRQALPLELDGIHKQELKEQVSRALDEMGIASISKRYPDQVSGGQRQRAAIARCFIGERKILLADEPTGALDSRSSEEVIRQIRSKVDQGLAGIIVTHDAKIAGWADRILIMRDGLIVEEVKASKSGGTR